MARLARAGRLLVLAGLLLALVACGGDKLPANATVVGTACAEVQMTDYGYRYGFGIITETRTELTYNGYSWVPRTVIDTRYGYGWSWGETGHHVETRCTTLYVTPTP